MGSTILCRVHTGLLYFSSRRITVPLSVVVWTDSSGCINTQFVHVNSYVPITLIPGRSPILKIVLSQASSQRETLLPSEAALQPQLSFNLLYRCKPSMGYKTSVFLFQVYISSLLLQIDPLHMCSVCWITRREYSRQTRIWCVGVSVSVIVRVSVLSQLLGSDQGKGKFIVRVRLGLGCKSTLTTY